MREMENAEGDLSTDRERKERGARGRRGLAQVGTRKKGKDVRNDNFAEELSCVRARELRINLNIDMTLPRRPCSAEHR